MGNVTIMSDKALIPHEKFEARSNGYKLDKVILKGYPYTLSKVIGGGINIPAMRLVPMIESFK